MIAAPLAICGEPEYSANPNASNLASGDVLMVTRLDRLRRTFDCGTGAGRTASRRGLVAA